MKEGKSNIHPFDGHPTEITTEKQKSVYQKWQESVNQVIDNALRGVNNTDSCDE